MVIYRWSCLVTEKWFISEFDTYIYFFKLILWVWYMYLFLQINIYNTAPGLKIAGPMYTYRKSINIKYFVKVEDSSTLF